MTDYQALFAAVTRDPHYKRNLDWGEPRRGHPEGTVRAHIAELERNLERLADRVSGDDYWKLKVLIHTHDTFKPDSAGEGAVPISHPRSHASLARAFLARFTDDQDLLAMTQLHDEPFALWNQRRSRGTYNRERFRRLLDSIRDWDLFARFLIIDGCTEGKSREPLRWFLREIAGNVHTTVGPGDML
ncbi:MAG TPA: hypothetical protein VGW38_00695 [Chloroflexota bacterium]|nr:hypothetical protein [Chloroflexota bacterium]